MEIETVSTKKHKGGFFFFILSVLCVGVCVVIAQFLASILTTTGMQASEIVYSSDYTLYAISLGNYTNKSEAESYAKIVQEKNAGGYVLEYDKKYYVIASIYEKENDADSVMKNIEAGASFAEIIKIKVEKANLDKLSSKNLQKEYVTLLNQIKDTYASLYDISISLDYPYITKPKAILEVDATRQKLEDAFDDLPKGSTSSDGEYYSFMKGKINLILDEIDSILDFNETASYPLSAKIKNTYIFIVDQILDLISEFNGEKIIYD